MEKELMCTCGCSESMHVDGCEHCACCVDCREFEEEETEEEQGFSEEQLSIISKHEKACKDAGCDDNGHKCIN